jgi:hypothetical protein
MTFLRPQEQKNDTDYRVVEVRNPNCAGGRKRQQAPGKRQERPNLAL